MSYFFYTQMNIVLFPELVLEIPFPAPLVGYTGIFRVDNDNNDKISTFRAFCTFSLGLCRAKLIIFFVIISLSTLSCEKAYNISVSSHLTFLLQKQVTFCCSFH